MRDVERRGLNYKEQIKRWKKFLYNYFTRFYHGNGYHLTSRDLPCMKNSLLCNHMEYSAEGQIPIVFQTIGSYKKFYSYFHFRGKNFEAPSGTALLAA